MRREEAAAEAAERLDASSRRRKRSEAGWKVLRWSIDIFDSLFVVFLALKEIEDLQRFYSQKA